MKQRQYRSNQGRSPEQQETNETLAFFGVIGLIIAIVAILIESNL